MRVTHLSVIPLTVSLCLAATTASAGLITSIGAPALVGSTIIDFDSEVDSSFVTKTISGVTFTADVGYSLSFADWKAGGDYGGSGQELSTVSSNRFFSIAFATPVSAFGMNWGGANENWTVTLLDSASSPIETLTFLGGDSGKGATYREFYGATGARISYVSFAAENPDWVKIDDFHYVSEASPPVSAPDAGSSLFLLGVSLVGLRAWKKRLDQVKVNA